eukprot:15207780-Alexandrium_andersonii.AAC.1
MSASLVGSEMCIRDRVGDPQVRVGSGPRLTAAKCCDPARRALRRIEAVSYTHLTLPTICSV